MGQEVRDNFPNRATWNSYPSCLYSELGKSFGRKYFSRICLPKGSILSNLFIEHSPKHFKIIRMLLGGTKESNNIMFWLATAASVLLHHGAHICLLWHSSLLFCCLFAYYCTECNALYADRDQLLIYEIFSTLIMPICSIIVLVS